jgi:hypothetical protein
MSNDSQVPENQPDRNTTNFPKDFIGFGESDFLELDTPDSSSPTHTDSPQPQELSIDSQKEYGVMEQSESTEDLEPLSTQSESATDSTGTRPALTKLEKVSLLAIAATLITISTLAVIHFSKDIPVDSLISKKVDLPVKGKILSVTSAETYWREAITEDDTPDIVRRGVKLIPVIKIQAEGKSGAIRILFRNSDGTLVGDSTTLAISGNETHTISATDGFTDDGMHAAYRTGEDPRWMIQVFEGPSANAPIDKFQTLFETEISTDIR